MASSFGKMLRKKREQQGLTLQDAAHKTRIPVTHLQHLEGDDLEGFHHAAYACCFLKLYANFLGVPPELLDERIGALMQPKHRPRARLAALLPWGLWGGPSRSPRPAAKQAKPSARPPVAASPVAVALTLFVLSLTGTALWGTHVSREWARLESQRSAETFDLPPPTAFPPQTPLGGRPQEPAIVKAIPVPEDHLEHLLPQVTGGGRAAE